MIRHFFNIGEILKSMAMGEIVYEVMKAYGQRINFKKTEGMKVVSSRNKVGVTGNLNEVEEEELFKIAENTIKMVNQFKYLGTEASSHGNMNAEVNKRIGTMNSAYKKFEKVTFNNKHLSLKKKLEMFVCMVVPAGLYNCSCWNVNTKQLKMFNTTARRLLMRLFKFEKRKRVSYELYH